MYSVLKLANMLKVGKNIILRAAVNQGLIDTSEYNRKIKLFNEYEKNKIQTEILNLNNLKNIIRIKSYNDTSEFTDIADLWKYDYFQDWNIKREIKFVDLFSGAGGIGVGFTMAGMQPIQNFEIFPEANETYAYNFKNLRKIINHDVDENDITELDSKNKLIKMLKSNMPDIIVGGFPCQGFSVSGIRSWNDPRNILYKSMLELVKKINPKIVIMENVLGILSMRNADGELVINEIIKMYQENGYEIDYKVLNSADYGVPQLRKRVIFIANNIGVKNLFPKPLYSNKWKTVNEALQKYENLSENHSINHIFTKHQDITIQRIAKLSYGESLYKGFSDSWKKMDPNKPSCTVKENHGGVNIHYSQNRVLTPRELAELQSFPEDFIFKGNKSKQLVQIGNAVPPLLAKAIACSAIKMLKQDENR